jgi:hypothetical protein
VGYVVAGKETLKICAISSEVSQVLSLHPNVN